MYQGKHTGSSGNSYNPDWVKPEKPRRSAAPSRRTNPGKKLLMTILALALLVTMGISGTVAWLSSSSSVSNQMTPGTGDITITETKDGNKKTSVKITNTGNIDVYVRVAVVSNRLDENGNVIAGASGNEISAKDSWQFLNGYYYYKGTVAPGAKNAVELLATNVDFTGMELDILAQSIQALGVIDGKPASAAAWGVVYNNGAWAPYTA